MQSLNITIAALKMAAARASNINTPKVMTADKTTTNDNKDTKDIDFLAGTDADTKQAKDLERWRKEDAAAEQAHRKLRREIISMFPEYSVVLEKAHRSINAVTLIAPDGREITFGLPVSTPEYVHLTISLTEKE